MNLKNKKENREKWGPIKDGRESIFFAWGTTEKKTKKCHLVIRIEKDESNHHEIIRSPANDESSNDDDGNTPLYKTRKTPFKSMK